MLTTQSTATRLMFSRNDIAIAALKPGIKADRLSEAEAALERSKALLDARHGPDHTEQRPYPLRSQPFGPDQGDGIMYKSAPQGATCTLPFAVGSAAAAAPVTRVFLLFVLAILFALGGCGGGGGGGSSNQPPVGPTTWTVSATAGAGGSIDPASRTVNAGSTATFTVTPDTGYSIGTVSGCGGSLVGNTYTTGAITGACPVAASFSPEAPAVVSLAWEPVSVKLFRFTWDDVAGATEYRLFENPDGNSGFTQVASIAPGVQSRDLTVFLPARVNARYMLSACNAGGCTDSATVFVSGNLAQAVGYVKASNTDRMDEFGSSVALSGDGNTLAVGAVWESSSATGINGNQAENSASASGAVYLY